MIYARWFSELIQNNSYNVYRIYKDNKQIGSVEFYQEERYIENIYLDEKCRGKGYLRKILNYFGKPLTCLPLPQHIDKFKHLGFIPYKNIDQDVYYILK